MSIKREELSVPGYEKVTYCEDASSGLRAIISIHSTALGAACGGIRLLPYTSREEALTDVSRLSKGMSYKSAVAGINFGGGKSVILCDPAKKTPAMFQAFGEFVESLEGRYIAAQDMNITAIDLQEVRKKTRHVLGVEGQPGTSGDPSPVTARGVLRALEATAKQLGTARGLDGIRIAIQGLGSVGYALAEMAYDAGAELFVSDISPQVVERAVDDLAAEPLEGDAIYEVECDIFSPNARGAILNQTTIPRLKCKAVCGAANNQLATDEDAMRLQERGILYAPDYVANAGGIINIFVEHEGYSQAKAFERTDRIRDTLTTIFDRARTEKVPPSVIADRMAEERIRAGR